MAVSRGNPYKPDRNESKPRGIYRSRRASRQRRPRQPLPLEDDLHPPSSSPSPRRLRAVQPNSANPSRPKPIPLNPTTRRSSEPSIYPNLKLPKLRTINGIPIRETPLGNRQMRRPPAATPLSQPLNPRRDNSPRRQTRRSTVSTQSEAKPKRQSSRSQPTQRGKSRRSRRSQKRAGIWIHVIRLLILGVGIGAIAGTLLSVLDPTSKMSMRSSEAAEGNLQESPTNQSITPALPLRQEISPLKAQVQTLVAKNPKLQPGVFVVDLDTGAYLDWQSHSIFPAASTIKVAILVAFFQEVDAGKIRLDEPLTMEPEMIAKGSGDMQYQKPGTQYSALEVATKMITISDNTATNMIIHRLGGIQAVNQRFISWGLTATAINNPLPDLEGTNTTNARDMANLLYKVNQGELLSLRSRDRLLDIMQRTVNNSLIPQGLDSGATVAHKTGDIGSVLGDVGIVDMPTGKRYLIVTLVKRPHNDASASELIRNLSRTVYDYFNKPTATPSLNSMPISTPAMMVSGLLIGLQGTIL
ncbi:beta-lactamase, putative [Coleofasciculus chthonoplastes PCC 7420]|uniref:Beta-lactamase, putative n=1 Tax=Coleofasciculus chthonoplastes PCC 7420 TaxID=118168 RepID=B4W2U5_9CYAN|nr:serine hydrolase [Coleofasciculus chthonoplastes]EDX71448.1 beta-lactamase, putative [Coleofasciculus chthonoplastes PCC 7420]